MEISFHRPAGALVVRVAGDARLWGREPGNDRLVELFRAQKGTPAKIVLNLAEVTQIDSLGVGALTRMLVECSKREMDLRIVAASGFAKQVLDRLHMLDAWPVFPDETAAIEN